MMKLKGLTVLMLLLVSLSAFSQAERKFIRRGNDAYEEKDFTQSEVNYRKALENDNNSFEAQFNVGDALYKQEKYEEAARQFGSLTSQDVSDQKLAKAYHNMGNAFLNANKLKESISAYKQALRHDPGDVQTKHNLTYALRKRKEQQQKQKQKQNQNQQKKQDQQDQNGQNPNQQNQQDPEQKKQQKKSPRSGNPQQKISKEDAKRLLQALQNDEKELQKKLKKKKAKSVNVKTTKNW